ncbi:dihydropteroate synthase [Algibacillus agarilyticus]|uniref:dihydropteroate synthase n=1 Tax=Algibacillus agarilyticus TaxID=2234133 RepID=UPI000DD021B0|nr:dihydropteroate synthase [Algibacillus agarilyticus]
MPTPFLTFLESTPFPLIMGILNTTPDSFSDGGRFTSIEKSLQHALKMQADGADVIDIGGESTRPGASPVSLQEELARVIPVIKAVKAETDVYISVDTSKPDVMLAAANAGADLVNDVRALTEPNALETVAQLKLPVCIMHMQGQPKTMQAQPHYTNVSHSVIEFLSNRIDACVDAGIQRNHIIVDPGFGFGKSFEHNFQLLAEFADLKKLQLPILAGLSRKSMIATATGQDVNHRVYGSIAGALICAQHGANILRVHDVQATKDALAVWQYTHKFIREY